MEKRFIIVNSGIPFSGFEYEYHFKDRLNPDATIIIKSGYSIKEPTESLANEYLNLLNEKDNGI